VLDIRLKKNNCAYPDDVSVLLQFPQLTSLDARTFVKDAKGNQLAGVLNVVSNLRRLTRLEIFISPLARLEVDTLAIDRMAELGKSGLPGGGDPTGVARCPIESLCCRCRIEAALFFVRWLPTLKHLDVDILGMTEPAAGYSALKLLNSLESLKLRLRRVQSIGFLFQVTRLDSLQLFQCQNVEFEILGQLPNLRSLSLSVSTSDVLASQQCAQVLTRLTSLSLDGDCMHESVKIQPLAANPVNIQSLSVTNVSLDAHHLMSCLTCLTSLTWNGSVSSTEIESLACLRRLRSICFFDTEHSVMKPSTVPLNHATFPELTALTMEVETDHLEWLHVVGQLTNLEVLGFLSLGSYQVCDKGFRELQNLSKLRALRVNRVVSHLEWTTNLKLWRRLESLHINICDTFHTTDRDLLKLEKLVPYLRVDYIGSNRYDFLYLHHQRS